MNKMREIIVPLNRLTVSEFNVRRTPAEASADAELKASLAALGLLQNLIVHEDKKREGYYAVDAGRRRAVLLQELADEGVIAEDYPVHCMLIEDTALAAEISLVENVMRVGMHPADEVETFAKLVHEGSTTAEIAVRFGMAERTVEQRLRLGNVSPVILEAYREGDTNLDTLMAFALTPDQNLQEEIWNNLREARGFVRDYQVREILLLDRIQGNSRIAKFVGMEDYEEAGGGVTRDMFAAEDEHGIWIEDPHTLYDLAERKLAALADGFKESWKWAESAIEFSYEEEAKFNKVYPVKGKFTPDEEAEMEGLTERRHKMLQAGLSDETRPEYNDVSEQMQDLKDLKLSRSTYTEEQRAIAGCVVSIDYAGKTKIIKGLVRAGDMPAASSSAGGTWRDPEKQVREQAGYSKKLMDAMRHERTKVVRSHLSGAFAEAFDLLLFQMAREVFGVERYFRRALDVELFRDSSSYGVADMVDVENLPIGWVREVDDSVAFEQMRSLTEEEKQLVFAVCIAATYKGQLTIDTGVNPEVELVVDGLSIDFNTSFRPAVDNFWGRLTKARILIIAEETLGNEWVDAHAGDKKAVLTKAMELAFAAGDELPEGVSPEGRAAALAWTPAGFVAG